MCLSYQMNYRRQYLLLLSKSKCQIIVYGRMGMAPPAECTCTVEVAGWPPTALPLEEEVC